LQKSNALVAAIESGFIVDFKHIKYSESWDHMSYKTNKAFTMVELLVVVMVFGISLGILTTIYSSVNKQGIKQDRTTATWCTYNNVMELLRMDLAKAIDVKISDHKIKITTMELNENFTIKKADIEWSHNNKNKLIRLSDNQKNIFDFGTSLPAKDLLDIKFALVP
jgi:prepilin-type N-terminal cleavage/methylation domain-containing protein